MCFSKSGSSKNSNAFDGLSIIRLREYSPVLCRLDFLKLNWYCCLQAPLQLRICFKWVFWRVYRSRMKFSMRRASLFLRSYSCSLRLPMAFSVSPWIFFRISSFAFSFLLTASLSRCAYAFLLVSNYSSILWLSCFRTICCIILLWKKVTFQSFWWNLSGKSSKLLSFKKTISWFDKRHSKELFAFCWYSFTRIVCSISLEAVGLEVMMLCY